MISSESASLDSTVKSLVLVAGVKLKANDLDPVLMGSPKIEPRPWQKIFSGISKCAPHSAVECALMPVGIVLLLHDAPTCTNAGIVCVAAEYLCPFASIHSHTVNMLNYVHSPLTKCADCTDWFYNEQWLRPYPPTFLKTSTKIITTITYLAVAYSSTPLKCYTSACITKGYEYTHMYVQDHVI